MKKRNVMRQPVDRLKPDPQQGLTCAQVLERKQRGWANTAALPASKTVGQIVFSNVFTFFNLIFFVLALCLVAVGSWHNLLFMIVVVLNTVIGIVQEIRAKITLDKLTLLSSPTAVAIRGGQAAAVPVHELVLDDVVLLTAGNQVGADAEVLTGEAELNESLLTGEADAVLKRPGDALLSGSYVVSGQCRARLCGVGQDSYAAQITSEARRHKRARSEMMTSLNRLIQFIAVLIVPFGLIMFFKQSGMPEVGFRQAVVSTVASAVGMIPEGLYLLTSMALAVSVINLARSKTLVHELTCIETLARVDVLCLDKTGTITEGDMEVLEVFPLAGCAVQRVESVLAAYAAASADDNVTARALRARFGGGASAPPWPVKKQIPFSSARKWGCIDFGPQGVFILGAPEFILGRDYSGLRPQVEELSAKGQRVLLLGACAALPEDNTPGPVRPLCLVTLSDKIRASAPETLRYFKEQGVDIRVISGDNPVTVSEVARRAGLENAGRCVDAQTLTTEEDFDRAVREHTVFGRVTPQQKRRLVHALKKQGHTVAMTGDGVNDVLALKDADCSVAMASGSEAAANVSQLVLLDSDFASMPKIVGEGRRVINNIERSAALFLVKNIFSFIVTLTLLFAALPYPFAPIQLTLISSLTIGFPAFVLALEPTHRRVQGRFMENVLRHALPGGLTDAAVILTVLAVGTRLDLDFSLISAICTIAVGFTGVLVLFFTCRPFDTIRRVLWVVVSVLLAASLVATWPLLVTATMNLDAWMLLAGALAVVLPLLTGLTYGVEFLYKIKPGRSKRR